MADIQTQDQEYSEFVNSQIEKLRPKLLDLTRRNPLISAPFSDRSSSLVRVVDEVPAILFDKLAHGKMGLEALPSLTEDPLDEKTPEFQSAYAAARFNDDEYLEKLDSLTEEDDAVEQENKLERELKDKIRGLLGLSPRQFGSDISYAQHAKNNNIRPSYDLPNEDQEDENKRHSDEDIQTLLVPEIFDRKLRSIYTKVDTWLSETGISVFQVAFGFLEWRENPEAKANFSPLILMPAKFERSTLPSGYRYSITGDEEVGDNFVLAEKLKKEFGIDFPKYEAGASIEGYFDEINEKVVVESQNHGRQWKFRRQVAIGVFPSARMAMYFDLDTSKFPVGEHEIISTLFAGAGDVAGSNPFGDDYEVDTPEIERKVPYLVTDADSSQFSTLVDVLNGKNTAVEGPPGTGKSQTIVNAIAAAIGSKKKVLFIAEKTAALDVVRSRLDALGLGEFMLPLLANRSGRHEIISSLRNRVESTGFSGDSNESDTRISKFREKRDEMMNYLNALKSHFGSTDLTVHEVLGRKILLNEKIEKCSKVLNGIYASDASTITNNRLDELIGIANEIKAAEIEIKQYGTHWSFIKIPNIDPYRVEEILKISSSCADAFNSILSVRKNLEELGFDQESTAQDIESLQNVLGFIDGGMSDGDIELALRIFENNASEIIEDFLTLAADCKNQGNKLSENISKPYEKITVDQVGEIIRLMEDLDLQEVRHDELNELPNLRAVEQKKLSVLEQTFDELTNLDSSFSEVSVERVLAMCRIGSLLNQETLALRGDNLKSPLSWPIIEKAKSDLEKIKESKSSLSDIFDFDGGYSSEAVKSNQHILSSAGFFSFFSKEYRDAKTFYSRVTGWSWPSIDGKKSKQTALEQLSLIANWLSEVEAFKSNKKIETLLGLNYEGLDTDFSKVDEVINYYKQIDENLTGTKNKNIREFLETADIDDIRSLPQTALQSDEVDEYKSMNFEEIRSSLSNLEKNIENLKSNAGKLSDLLLVFIEWEGLSFAKIKSIMVELDTFHSNLETINNHDASEILGGDYFSGPDTTRALIHDALATANFLSELKSSDAEPLIKHIKEKTHETLVNLLSEISHGDKYAEDILNQFKTSTECESEFLDEGITKSGVAEFMRDACEDKQGLISYSRLVGCKYQLADRGYGLFLEKVQKYQNLMQDLDQTLRCFIANSMAREVYQEYGSKLTQYNGTHLDELRTEIADLDAEIISLSKQRLRSTLISEASPPAGIGRGPKSTWTEMSLIENEINKTRAFISPRDLAERAGRALLELKPCWMMSPLAVAQYIDKGSLEFDLVIIDEASQMTPENAIGAIVRSKQAMIVGDTNQLPPTNFFRTMIASNDEDEDDTNEESILEIANANFRPKRRLKWHYRSRNSSLIAFSNKWIYNDELVVFPSASENNPKMGVSFIPVEGEYSARTNPIEAKVMAEAIAEFMRTDTERSLGVVTINSTQRDLLADEFEFLSSSDSIIARYIKKWKEKDEGLQGFFIKNLENVQGDERDVIFIGTVYGPEKRGATVMQRFGPINGVAGKRRLNVLFSRAKQQTVTFSSMTSGDIRAEASGNEGVYLLKLWLQFAASGVVEGGEVTNKAPDSDFEEYVIEQIEAIGCQAVPQVGVKGFSIDIGVKHPNWPHGFLMGVECDGATYHSSRSARDRDRIRQNVLEGLGWYLHRIWSTDWFDNPRAEAERLRKVITQRLETLNAMGSEEFANIAVTSINEVDSKDVSENLNISEEANEADQSIQARRLIYEWKNKKLRSDIQRETQVEQNSVVREQTNQDDLLETDGFDENTARRKLIELREQIYDEIHDVDRKQGLLRKSMIDHFLRERPVKISEFTASIPFADREKIDRRQMKYIDEIFEIIENID